MTEEERSTLESAQDIVAIANAMLRIKSHDARRTAVGLLTIMEALLAGDSIGRIALATLMAEAITELLRGIPSEELPENIRWWH
jgi:hypothetical protein